MLINVMLVKKTIEFNRNALRQELSGVFIALDLLEKNPGSLVTTVVALFFAEHWSAINSPIAISSALLSLNSLTLDYIGLLESFSVSSIHITWMLEDVFYF